MRPAKRWQRAGWLCAYAGVVAIGLVQRLQRLDPASLWYDDQWVTVIALEADLAQFFQYKATVPMAFVAALRLGLLLVSDIEIAMQLVPLLCSLAVCVATGLLISRETGRPALGLAAAALLAVHPFFAGYSMRVKQFSWDALAVVGVLWIALPTLRGRATLGLAHIWGCIGLCALSYVSALVSVPLLHVAALRATFEHGALTLNAASRARALRCFGRVALFDFAFAGYYLLRLRHQVRGEVVEFWEGRGGMPAESALGPLIDFVSPNAYFWRGFFNAVGIESSLLALLFAAAALTALFRNAGTRWIALFFAVFVFELAVAAMLRVYPFGGTRIAIFSYPVTLVGVALSAALGLDKLEERWPTFRAIPTVAGPLLVLTLAAFAIRLPAFAPYEYYQSGASKFVALVEERHRQGETILVGWQQRYAVGIYSSWPTRYVTHAGKPWLAPTNERVAVLIPNDDGWIDALSRAERVSYLWGDQTALPENRRQWEDEIAKHGFSLRRRIEGHGDGLSLFERSH